MSYRKSTCGLEKYCISSQINNQINQYMNFLALTVNQKNMKWLQHTSMFSWWMWCYINFILSVLVQLERRRDLLHSFGWISTFLAQETNADASNDSCRKIRIQFSGVGWPLGHCQRLGAWRLWSCLSSRQLVSKVVHKLHEKMPFQNPFVFFPVDFQVISCGPTKSLYSHRSPQSPVLPAVRGCRSTSFQPLQEVQGKE